MNQDNNDGIYEEGTPSLAAHSAVVVAAAATWGGHSAARPPDLPAIAWPAQACQPALPCTYLLTDCGGRARAKIYFWSQSSLFSLYKGRHGRVCSLQTRGETIEVTRVEKEVGVK